MSAPDKVTICVVSNNSENEFDVFSSLLHSSINIPVSIIVFDAGSKSESTKTIGKLLVHNHKGKYINGDVCRLSEAYNELLDNVKTDYCTFIPINNILSDNWLPTILHNYKMINDSGVVSIKSQNDNLYISGLLADENIILNYLEKNNTISGMLFGKTALLREVNGFNSSGKIDGFEFEEISHRIMLRGKKNYYVTHAKRYEMPICNETLFPVKTNETLLECAKTFVENFKKSRHGEQSN